MNEAAIIAAVRKSVRVKASVERAFEIFTARLNDWWPANHGIGEKPIAKDFLECRLGGRWIELSESGKETVVATVIGWEPPTRLVLQWQVNEHWKPDPSMRSEVDVRFIADGPSATIVDLVHHKFETMGAAAGTSMRKDVDGGWPGLLELYVKAAERGA